MKWKNLKKNKCPRDSRLLDYNSKVAFCSCGFVIGLEKLARYSEGQTLKDLAEKQEDVVQPVRDSWWNNI